MVTSPKLGYRREMSHVNIMKYDRALTTAKSIDATSTQYQSKRSNAPGIVKEHEKNNHYEILSLGS